MLQWGKFRNLQSKTLQTFLDFSAEVQQVLENWLKAAKVGSDFKKLKDLFIKDYILSAVPAKMANFLLEQRVGDLEDLESKGQHFDANKVIFASCTQSEWTLVLQKVGKVNYIIESLSLSIYPLRRSD